MMMVYSKNRKDNLSDKEKAIPQSLQVSQAVFAEFLGVSVGAVRDWEQEITNDLEGWSRRIRELANLRHGMDSCRSSVG